MIDVQFSVYYAVSFSIHYTDDKTKVQRNYLTSLKSNN